MQKIYVLLRGDQQTGPYSLEEIAQLNLKPYDLIWIEGKSAGWYYPQEIKALHPYLPFLQQKPKPAVQNTTEAKKVFVAMPSSARAEEPPITPSVEKTPFYPKETNKPSETISVSNDEDFYAKFTKASEEINSSYANSQAKTKQKKQRSISVGGAIAAVLVVGGVFAASWIMNPHSNPDETSIEPTASAPVQNETVTTTAVNHDRQKSGTVPLASKQKQQKHITAPKQILKTVKEDAPVKEEKKVVATNPAKMPNDKEVARPSKEDRTTTVEETPIEKNAPQEKKKKLRDKIFDIFKKKPQEQKTDEAQSTQEEDGQRSATHREAGANLAQMVSVRFTIPNDWMMGIKGAKATLVNRSNETITKATVEVLYYNDDNELLQKKVVSFSKVEGKSSQSVSIPDHPTATRVDYNLVSVTGSGHPAA